MRDRLVVLYTTTTAAAVPTKNTSSTSCCNNNDAARYDFRPDRGGFDADCVFFCSMRPTDNHSSGCRTVFFAYFHSSPCTACLRHREFSTISGHAGELRERKHTRRLGRKRVTCNRLQVELINEYAVVILLSGINSW